MVVGVADSRMTAGESKTKPLVRQITAHAVVRRGCPMLGKDSARGGGNTAGSRVGKFCGGDLPRPNGDRLDRTKMLDLEPFDQPPTNGL